MANEFKVKNGLIVDNGGAQVTGGITGSIAATNNIVSSSAQITPLLPTGTVSGSSQVNFTQLSNISNGIVSSSAQVTPLLPSGVVSSSAQLTNTFAGLNTANVFTGNQTITGSLYVSQNFIVAGSSSIQNISSSTLSIGTNLITVNTLNPSVRFGGLAVIDSGSTNLSGSILFDSINNQWIFQHQAVSGAASTSSIFITGPETLNALGSETNLTGNRIPKIKNGAHLNDSNISDDGTTITLGSNTSVTGTITATTHIGSIAATNGVVSGSSQVNFTQISNISNGIVSSSAQVTPLLPTGTVSGSSQVNFTQLSSISSGIVSSSTQVTPLLPTGTISGSIQVLGGSTIHSGSANNYQFNSIGVGSVAPSGTAGRIDASGDIVAFSTSDKNFKENITPITNALEKISKISGNTYDWKPELKEFHGFEGNDIGVIAQEIEEVLPQLVTTRETGYKAVKYDKLVALLIEGIKEQQQQIHSLTLEVENLKKNKGL